MSYKKLKSILEDGYLKIYVDELKDKLKEHGIGITNAEEENYEVTISFSIHGIPSRSQIVEIKNLFKDFPDFEGVENPKDLIFIYRFSKLVELI